MNKQAIYDLHLKAEEELLEDLLKQIPAQNFQLEGFATATLTEIALMQTILDYCRRSVSTKLTEIKAKREHDWPRARDYQDT